jgi:tol-pal system protein YbgF
LSLLCAALPAHAGLFDDEEARKRISDLKTQVDQAQRRTDDRLLQIEDSIKNLGMVELLRQLELLKEDLARLRGQIEVLANGQEQLGKKQRDFYLDLDSRLRRLEGGAPASPSGATLGAAPAAAGPPLAGAPTIAAQPSVVPAAPATGANAGSPATRGQPLAAAPPNPNNELRAYDAASNLFKKNDFVGSVNAFMGFIAEFPSSTLVPNAYYWIGISHANLKDGKAALAAQETVVRRYADSPKAPDAMLAIAQLQAESGDQGSARDTLDGLINRYPQSEAAQKARTRLSQGRR